MDEDSRITMLGADALAELLPHGAGMSMLDEVVTWGDAKVHCRTRSHRRGDNPLLANGAQQSILLVEYAAQAAAVHAGLLQSQLGEARPAYVGAVKNIEICQPTLPESDDPLDVVVTAEYLSQDGAIYRFDIDCVAERVISGRLILSQPS